MRVAEYKRIDERTEEYTVTVPAEYDEDGNITVEEHEETRTRTIPVMGMVYRDMTPEEEAEYKIQQEVIPESEPTAEEQLATLKEQQERTDAAVQDLIIAMMGGV